MFAPGAKRAAELPPLYRILTTLCNADPSPEDAEEVKDYLHVHADSVLHPLRQFPEPPRCMKPSGALEQPIIVNGRRVGEEEASILEEVAALTQLSKPQLVALYEAYKDDDVGAAPEAGNGEHVAVGLFQFYLQSRAFALDIASQVLTLDAKELAYSDELEKVRAKMLFEECMDDIKGDAEELYEKSTVWVERCSDEDAKAGASFRRALQVHAATLWREQLMREAIQRQQILFLKLTHGICLRSDKVRTAVLGVIVRNNLFVSGVANPDAATERQSSSAQVAPSVGERGVMPLNASPDYVQKLRLWSQVLGVGTVLAALSVHSLRGDSLRSWLRDDASVFNRVLYVMKSLRLRYSRCAARTSNQHHRGSSAPGDAAVLFSWAVLMQHVACFDTTLGKSVSAELQEIEQAGVVSVGLVALRMIIDDTTTSVASLDFLRAVGGPLTTTVKDLVLGVVSGALSVFDFGFGSSDFADILPQSAPANACALVAACLENEPELCELHGIPALADACACDGRTPLIVSAVSEGAGLSVLLRAVLARFPARSEWFCVLLAALASSPLAAKCIVDQLRAWGTYAGNGAPYTHIRGSSSSIVKCTGDYPVEAMGLVVPNGAYGASFGPDNQQLVCWALPTPWAAHSSLLHLASVLAETVRFRPADSIPEAVVNEGRALVMLLSRLFGDGVSLSAAAAAALEETEAEWEAEWDGGQWDPSQLLPAGVSDASVSLSKVMGGAEAVDVLATALMRIVTSPLAMRNPQSAELVAACHTALAALARVDTRSVADAAHAVLPALAPRVSSLGAAVHSHAVHVETTVASYRSSIAFLHWVTHVCRWGSAHSLERAETRTAIATLTRSALDYACGVVLPSCGSWRYMRCSERWILARAAVLLLREVLAHCRGSAMDSDGSCPIAELETHIVRALHEDASMFGPILEILATNPLFLYRLYPIRQREAEELASLVSATFALLLDALRRARSHRAVQDASAGSQGLANASAGSSAPADDSMGGSLCSPTALERVLLTHMHVPSGKRTREALAVTIAEFVLYPHGVSIATRAVRLLHVLAAVPLEHPPSLASLLGSQRVARLRSRLASMVRHKSSPSAQCAALQLTAASLDFQPGLAEDLVGQRSADGGVLVDAVLDELGDAPRLEESAPAVLRDILLVLHGLLAHQKSLRETVLAHGPRSQFWNKVLQVLYLETLDRTEPSDGDSGTETNVTEPDDATPSHSPAEEAVRCAGRAHVVTACAYALRTLAQEIVRVATAVAENCGGNDGGGAASHAQLVQVAQRLLSTDRFWRWAKVCSDYGDVQNMEAEGAKALQRCGADARAAASAATDCCSFPDRVRGPASFSLRVALVNRMVRGHGTNNAKAIRAAATVNAKLSYADAQWQSLAAWRSLIEATGRLMTTLLQTGVARADGGSQDEAETASAGSSASDPTQGKFPALLITAADAMRGAAMRTGSRTLSLFVEWLALVEGMAALAVPNQRAGRQTGALFRISAEDAVPIVSAAAAALKRALGLPASTRAATIPRAVAILLHTARSAGAKVLLPAVPLLEAATLATDGVPLDPAATALAVAASALPGAAAASAANTAAALLAPRERSTAAVHAAATLLNGAVAGGAVSAIAGSDVLMRAVAAVTAPRRARQLHHTQGGASTGTSRGPQGAWGEVSVLREPLWSQHSDVEQRRAGAAPPGYSTATFAGDGANSNHWGSGVAQSDEQETAYKFLWHTVLAGIRLCAGSSGPSTSMSMRRRAISAAAACSTELAVAMALDPAAPSRSHALSLSQIATAAYAASTAASLTKDRPGDPAQSAVASLRLEMPAVLAAASSGAVRILAWAARNLAVVACGSDSGCIAETSAERAAAGVAVVASGVTAPPLSPKPAAAGNLSSSPLSGGKQSFASPRLRGVSFDASTLETDVFTMALTSHATSATVDALRILLRLSPDVLDESWKEDPSATSPILSLACRTSVTYGTSEHPSIAMVVQTMLECINIMYFSAPFMDQQDSTATLRAARGLGWSSMHQMVEQVFQTACIAIQSAAELLYRNVVAAAITSRFRREERSELRSTIDRDLHRMQQRLSSLASKKSADETRRILDEVKKQLAAVLSEGE